MSRFQKGPHEKTISEMNEGELRDYLADSSILPLPPVDAPTSEFHKWLVADFFLSFCKEAKTPDEGKINAVNFLLGGAHDWVSNLRPYIESALGRKLTENELTDEIIFDV